MPRFDEDMTAAEWAAQEERDAAEDMVRFEREHRFREDVEPEHVCGDGTICCVCEGDL